MSSHHGWEVFRGERFEANGLVFTVEQVKRFQISATMKLFLATNSEKQECDYRIEGSFLTRSLKVYKGDSSQVVAGVRKLAISFCTDVSLSQRSAGFSYSLLALFMCADGQGEACFQHQREELCDIS